MKERGREREKEGKIGKGDIGTVKVVLLCIT